MGSTTANIFRSQWRRLVVFLTPLLLAPLPIFYPKKEYFCAYAVLVMAIYWMTEALPLAVTGTFTISFPISVFYRVIIIRHRTSPTYNYFINILFGLMLGFQLATAFLSMWLSNTATTAMMVPIAMAVIVELHHFSSFKANNATHTSIVFEEAEETDENLKESVENHKKLEEKEEEPEETKQLDSNFDPTKIPERELSTYKGFMLAICYSANIGGTGTLIGTGSNIVLSGQLTKLYKDEDDISFATWMVYAVPPMIIYLSLSWVLLQSYFIGFRNINRADERVKKMLRNKYTRLGPLRFDEILVSMLFFLLVMLWLFRDPEVIPGWNKLFKKGFVTDGTSAMFVACLLFILPSKNPWRTDSHESPPALMTWREMQKNFSWSTMFLLGGGYAMAAGVVSSGLSDLIAHKMTSMTVLPHWVFVTISITLVVFLTEFNSNVATASIFIPLICGVADHVHVNPLYFALPITLACSFAFMLPVATPPNAIVFSSKLLRVVDMVKAGFIMNLMCIPLTVLFTHTWAWWLFKLGTVPKWALEDTSTSIPTSTVSNMTL